MRRWMSRLSYSFLIVAGVLGYQAYLVLGGRSEDIPRWHGVLFAVGGALSLGLGLTGLRIRNEELRRKAERDLLR